MSWRAGSPNAGGAEARRRGIQFSNFRLACCHELSWKTHKEAGCHHRSVERWHVYIWLLSGLMHRNAVRWGCHRGPLGCVAFDPDARSILSAPCILRLHHTRAVRDACVRSVCVWTPSTHRASTTGSGERFVPLVFRQRKASLSEGGQNWNSKIRRFLDSNFQTHKIATLGTCIS